MTVTPFSILILFFSRTALGGELFSGRVFTDQYFYTGKAPAGASTLAQSSYSTWLEMNSENKNFVNVHAVGAETLFLKSFEYPHTARGTFQLREGYLSYANESWEVKCGQQIIPWGKSDGINPTDYWTAKNYTVQNPDDEVRRFGAPTFSFNFTPLHGASPVTFTGIVQGSHPQNKLLIPDSVIPPSPVPFKKYPNTPELISADDAQYGFKFSYQKSNYDFSLSVFRGFAQLPHYEFDGASIYPTYSPETAWGADTSFTIEEYIIRFESAIHLPDDGGDDNLRFGLVEPQHWDTVLGVERPVLKDFRVQVQAVLHDHLTFRSPEEYRGVTPLSTAIHQAVGRANALIANYQDSTLLGSTFRFAYQPESGDWTADIFMLGYFGSAKNFALRPQVSYKPAEGFKLTTGADIYGGDSNSQLGSLKAFSAAFFEGKWVF